MCMFICKFKVNNLVGCYPIGAYLICVDEKVGNILKGI